MNYDVIEGDAFSVLKEVPDAFAATCATSPPYWKKRDYGHTGQLGQEATPELFVSRLSDIFDEVQRVLVPTGSLWVNIDDTFLNNELVGVPWLLVFEMKKRGWHLRGDAIWWKSNSTPEPAKNRLSRCHEYVFHFTRQPSGYYFDMDAIREPHTNPWALDCIAKFQANPTAKPKINLFSKKERHDKQQRGVTRAEMGAKMNPLGKHRRDVFTDDRMLRLKADLTRDQLQKLNQPFSYFVNASELSADLAALYEPVKIEFLSLLTVNTNKFRGQHYAPYPKHLVSSAILATCPKGGLVLDPFCGSGTTGVAALEAGFTFLGIELVPESVNLALEALARTQDKRMTA
jgi:DNA modification methylase